VVESGWSDQPDSPVLAAIDDTLFAYNRIGSTGIDGDNQIWRSTDRRTWENLGQAPWPSNAEIRGGIAVHDGVGVLWTVDGEENAKSTILRSEDGVAWDSPSVPPPPDIEYGGTPFPLHPGWMSIRNDVWVSSDGDVWEKINIRGLPTIHPNGHWGEPSADSENTAFHGIYYSTEQGLVLGRISQIPS
jgi:hypothetical protein